MLTSNIKFKNFNISKIKNLQEILKMKNGLKKLDFLNL